METIDLYSAIAQMRLLTKENKPFSFSFMSYNRDKQTSEGVVHVARAKLRGETHEENNQFADMMLNYLNIDTNEPRQCWQPAILFFNGIKVELN